jgi:hypothetical protein
MGITHLEVHLRGKKVYVPSAQVENRTIVAKGRWLKMAMVHDEELVEGEIVRDPESFAHKLKESGLGADIFTFSQKPPHTAPRHSYQMEWDNWAVIPITTYSEWFKKRAESSVQRAVRKAAKSGVVVSLAEFDDAFVSGIVGIHDESPVRQGMPFWHFRESFEDVKRDYSTYSERNVFVAAYYQDEMIGFIRMTYADKVAHIIQILSKIEHLDKRTSNALIAKAVEVCEQQGISYLVYCNYVYKDPKSSLTEFKRRNGFEAMLLPRYYIPLTLKGKLALGLGVHRGLAARIPKSVVSQLLKIRSMWYDLRFKAAKETA